MAASQIVFYNTSSALQHETLLWTKTGGGSEWYDKTLISPPEAARRRTFIKINKEINKPVIAILPWCLVTCECSKWLLYNKSVMITFERSVLCTFCISDMSVILLIPGQNSVWLLGYSTGHLASKTKCELIHLLQYHVFLHYWCKNSNRWLENYFWCTFDVWVCSVITSNFQQS